MSAIACVSAIQEFQKCRQLGIRGLAGLELLVTRAQQACNFSDLIAILIDNGALECVFEIVSKSSALDLVSHLWTLLCKIASGYQGQWVLSKCNALPIAFSLLSRGGGSSLKILCFLKQMSAYSKYYFFEKC
jgi:hypothetical protein